MFFPLRIANTSSSNQEAFRNSNAARKPPGTHSRKSASSAVSFLKFGGNWNKTGPSFVSRSVMTWQKYCIVSPQFFSFAKCVTFCGAFRLNLKRSGVASHQFWIVFGLGMRRKL